VSATVLEDREFRETVQRDGGIKCAQCKKWTHDEGKMNKTFAHKVSLVRHRKNAHTPWTELELQMVQFEKDGSVSFRCPSDEFTANKPSQVRQHCLSDACVNHTFYRRLKTEHNEVDRSRPTEKSIKERLAKRTDSIGLEDYTQLPLRSRLGRMTKEMLFDYVKVHSGAGELTDDHRDILQMVHDICRDETNEDDSGSENDVDEEVDYLQENMFSILFKDE